MPKNKNKIKGFVESLDKHIFNKAKAGSGATILICGNLFP